MTDKETLPFKAARKLNMLIMHNEALAKDKSLQEKIIAWGLDMLEEARTDWSDLHNTVLDAVITCDRKQEAKRKALIKDEKYAPFREYFKNLQYKKFISYQKQGKNLSASAFVRYFLKSKAHVVDIPYKNSNWEIKLNQLAQANNREFKKSSCMM
ncbi:MAG: hypothetical protein IKK52_04285 [Alphaproteobacteria bacterium]|nr:hypothetical protein [Alphaproteobacteria bacterium]